MKQSQNYMEVAERLYKHMNPTSTMECPNSVYLTMEKWVKEYYNSDNTTLDLLEWCLQNKS